jgi:hypothetical protein
MLWRKQKPFLIFWIRITGVQLRIDSLYRLSNPGSEGLPCKLGNVPADNINGEILGSVAWTLS